MSTEAPTKKPWDKEPITAAEWKANQARIQAVIDEDSEFLRKKLKDGIAGIVGRIPDPRKHSVKMTEWLIRNGLLSKPDWHSRSTLTLEHFATEELADAFNTLKLGFTPQPKDEVDDIDCPF